MAALVRMTIGTAVKRALGSKARGISKRDLEKMAQQFVASGSLSLRGQDSPADSARLMNVARQTLARGRRGLAASTTPGAPAVLVDRAWRLYQQAIEQHRDSLLRKPGVVGVGLGYRRCRQDEGVRTRKERCVLIFVRRKLKTETLRRRGQARIPRTLRVGSRRVPTDVVEFGSLQRQSAAGDSLGPAGRRDMGSLGTFAIDSSTGATLALTAMHVTGRKAFPPGTGMDIVSPSLMENGSRTLLGSLLRGTMHGIDAAAISVDRPRDVEWRIKDIGPINGWRPLSHPGDLGTVVQMFGAKTGRRVIGRIVDTCVDLPELDLGSVILVDILSDRGDSGAAIVDNEGFVLGLLVGTSSKLEGLRVFTPISSVLARLACDIVPPSGSL